MKKIIVRLFMILTFCSMALAESSLSKCEGSNFTKWTNCFGKEKLKNGIYIGEYRNGNFHGQGSLTFDNGEKYEGQFVNGNRDGQGTVIFIDGTKYIGQFKDGKFDGQGTYTYPDGTKYIGQFKDGKGTDKLGINIPSFKEEIFFNSVKKLKEYFEIIHIHGNNHFPKSDTGLPMIIEMTLLNKKYTPKKIEYINNFPIKDLDYPNQPFAKDLFFSFQN